MHALITTCTADKDPSRHMVPARDRYRGARVCAAVARSERSGLPLLFLSGVYGVISAETPLPWYDHALRPDEVDGLIPVIADQLAVIGPTVLTALLRPAQTPGWQPYHRLLIGGCQQAGVSLHIEPTTLS